ncbi:hypothetical protein DTO271G3_7276 [Paecilomyces variotii]|nr:hypothetical protein DTO271G3_7276 [Paecilomyces variotii]
MATIRKVVITEFGDVDVIKIFETSCPPPAPEFVQTATEYSGFTGGDVKALGEGCTTIKEGDMVAVLTKYDSQAELVNQPVKYCIKIPDGLDHQQVTALMCDWSTAYAMATQTAKVTKGQRVFVQCLSGAVGCGLMILCSLLGAEWMGNMEELGGAHAVFDPLGFESFEESYSILTEDGILVAYGNNMDSLAGKKPRDPTEAIMKMLSWNSDSPTGKKITFFGLTRDSPTYASDIYTLMDMMAKGKFEVPIKKVWAMNDIRTAHRQWGEGTALDLS